MLPNSWYQGWYKEGNLQAFSSLNINQSLKYEQVNRVLWDPLQKFTDNSILKVDYRKIENKIKIKMD